MKKAIGVVAALAISVAVPALAEVGTVEEPATDATVEAVVENGFDEETGILTWTITTDDGVDITYEIQVVEPGEKVNHGKVVSAFVHALKEDGHKGIGRWVRDVAKSDAGKKDKDGGVVASEEETSFDLTNGKGKGKNKDKGN